MRFSLLIPVLCVSALWLAAPAAAQQGEEPTDEELIRWATREVGRQRVSARHYPPVPPDGYLRRSSEPIQLAGESDEQVGLRLLAEFGGGSLGLLIGGGAGTLLIWAALEGNASPDWRALAFGGGTVLGALGLTAGLTLAAEFSGGQGNFGHAFLGQIFGAVAALPIVAFGQANDSLALSLVAAGLLPLAGAILGYEIGHAESALPSGTLAYLSPVDDGVIAGVAGPLP